MTCPRCANQQQSSFTGIEVRGVYDGVLFWVCQACDWAWPSKFSGRRAELAERYAREYNQRR